MLKICYIIFLILGFSKSATAKNAINKPLYNFTILNQNNPKLAIHASFNALLKKHVDEDGNVNYKTFLKEKSKLEAYLNLLSKVTVNHLTKNQQMAFWINAYNAATIDIILINYPIKSIKNINNGKVWDMPLPYPFEGKKLTLNEIENNKLLKNFNDARIHFAINCAAKSCPKLNNKAFTDLNIQQMLNDNTQAFLNNTAYNKISNSETQISQIFNWFEPDFVKAEGSLIGFVNKYAKKQIKLTQKINFLDYDWDLNEN